MTQQVKAFSLIKREALRQAQGTHPWHFRYSEFNPEILGSTRHDGRLSRTDEDVEGHPEEPFERHGGRLRRRYFRGYELGTSETKN